MRRLLTVLFALSALFVCGFASAEKWQPPALRGHVVDETATLTPAQIRQLNAKLDTARTTNGYAVVVFVASSLHGETLEDLAFAAARTWKVGEKGADDGVVLVAVPSERKLRIEVGKGLGGALTDLQSSRINREVIGPQMREGKLFEAMDRGTDAILRELAAGGSTKAAKKPPNKALGVVLNVVIISVVLGFFWFLVFGIRRLAKGSRGGSSDGAGGAWVGGSDYGSSGGGSDYSSGGGGSDYSGGGGDFGGGGSSDSY